MGQTKKKVFNEEKYQKNRKSLNYVGMAVVVLSIILGGLVMYLGNRFVRNAFFEGSGLNLAQEENGQPKETIEAKVILKDGSLVPVPHTPEEYQAAIAKVEEQYPTGHFADYNYNFANKQDGDEDKRNLESAYKKYIKSQQGTNDEFESMQAKIDAESKAIKGVAGTVFKVILTILSLLPGLTIMVVGILVGSKILVTANGRGIAGFFAQTYTPVVKETVEDLTPTAGRVVETLSRGVKKGFSDKKKK